MASSSPYRRDLLDRILSDYEAVSPDIDETDPGGMTPSELATYLARRKAEAVAVNARDAIVIGADQIAVLGDRVLGKPGTHQKAVEQLRFIRAMGAIDPLAAVGRLLPSGVTPLSGGGPSQGASTRTRCPARRRARASASTCICTPPGNVRL